MFLNYWIIKLLYKPFMRRRADVRLWRVLVSYFKYKPFMWCRPDVRLWHAPSLFSVISPLCGVAPTPDCGIIIPHFPLEESFRHSFGTSITILQFPLEASFRPSLGTQYFTLNYFNHLRASWFSYLFVTDVWSHNNPEHVFDLLYPCSLCLRVHSNVLTGLSLAIVLARFLAWR